ncbi:unnamed protein product [Symbiodinium microadriaticum]|nr:unnamed protein product [Symbiodinium microadriaticum]
MASTLYVFMYIASDDSWSGEFWLAGRDGRHGTFALSRVTVGANTAYSGDFSETPGLKYTMYGYQNSTDEPSALDCFKADDSLLEQSPAQPAFDFTGVWVKPVGTGLRYLFTEGGDIVSSYFYGPMQAPGFNVGPISSDGLVYASNWFEVDSYEGMYLFVAQNQTAFYSLWWWFDSVASFDFSFHDDPSYFGQGMNYRDTGSRANSEMAHMNECLELSLADLEDSCFDDAEGEEDEDDDDESMLIMVSILVVTCCVFVAVILSLMSQAFSVANKPAMAKQEQRSRGNSEL